MCWIMATIIIAYSNLSNMGFFASFVFSWCALVDKFDNHIANRANSLKFELNTRASLKFIRTFSEDITSVVAIALKF